MQIGEKFITIISFAVTRQDSPPPKQSHSKEPHHNSQPKSIFDKQQMNIFEVSSFRFEGAIIKIDKILLFESHLDIVYQFLLAIISFSITTLTLHRNGLLIVSLLYCISRSTCLLLQIWISPLFFKFSFAVSYKKRTPVGRWPRTSIRQGHPN